MELHTDDIVAAMTAETKDFPGSGQDPAKAEAYGKLKAHAAAIARVLHAPWHAEDPTPQKRNAFVCFDVPLPVNILNTSIRGRLAALYQLADMVTLSSVHGRLRMTFTVANVWNA